MQRALDRGQGEDHDRRVDGGDQHADADDQQREVRVTCSGRRVGTPPVRTPLISYRFVAGVPPPGA